jgi:hypothetical protein
MISRDNELVRIAAKEIGRLLPLGWRIEEGIAIEARNSAADGRVAIAAPDGRRAVVLVEARRSLDPRGASELARRLGTDLPGETVIVVSPYLAAGVRDRLKASGLGYVDFTGNARLTLSSPGLHLETAGADSDPNPSLRPTRSLRGPKAGRVIRVLCDSREPGGVRDLAGKTGLDPGYVSRILALLDREDLVERDRRGRILKVEWERLLRRWAQEVPFESRGQASSYLEPRGLPALLERLPRSRMRYVIAGSLAASRLAPIAPPRLATLYVESLDRAAGEWSLRPAEAGGNVVLVLPTDDWVFAGAEEIEAIQYAAPSQVAADLLTGPGRGPAEAEELLRWMTANEEKWRG